MACKDMLGRISTLGAGGGGGEKVEGEHTKGASRPATSVLRLLLLPRGCPLKIHTHTPSHCCASCTNDQRTCRSDDLVFENGAPRSGTRRQNSRPAVERSRPIGFCTTLLDLKQMDYKETSV